MRLHSATVTDAKTLPQRYFISPEIFAGEQARIFSNHWLLVGHQSQIAKPGDFFLTPEHQLERRGERTVAGERGPGPLN